VGASLNETLQERVQHVGPVAHQTNILRGTVDTLPVLDRALEHVAKLGFGTEVVGTNEIHHTPAQNPVRIHLTRPLKTFVIRYRHPTFLHWGAFDSAKNRKRQSVTAKRAKSQTPKFVWVMLGRVGLS